jgi:hypothetical protein
VTVDIRPIPRPGWDPLPYEGCVGVVGRVLVREDTYFVAQLRFSEHATIHEHPGDNDTVVAASKAKASRRSQARARRYERESKRGGRDAYPTGSGPKTRP